MQESEIGFYVSECLCQQMIEHRNYKTESVSDALRHVAVNAQRTSDGRKRYKSQSVEFLNAHEKLFSISIQKYMMFELHEY